MRFFKILIELSLIFQNGFVFSLTYLVLKVSFLIIVFKVYMNFIEYDIPKHELRRIISDIH